MSLEAKLMLENLHDTFTKQSKDALTGWDRMVEFIAVDHNASLLQQLDHKFGWLLGNREFAQQVSNAYDPVPLRKSPDDDLGNLYRARFATFNGNTRQTRPSKLELLVTQRHGRTVIIDRRCGTGERLISQHRLHPKGVMIGADPDIRKVRIAMANAAVKDIPGHFLVADQAVHDLGLNRETGRQNWE